MSNINTTSQVLNNIAGVEDLTNENAADVSGGIAWLGVLPWVSRGRKAFNWFSRNYNTPWRASTINRWKRNPNTMVRDFGAKVLFGAPL
jgi:hypothetical protein